MAGLTASEIFDLADTDEPEIWGALTTRHHIGDHHLAWEDFVSEHGDHDTYPAATVLGWLGY